MTTPDRLAAASSPAGSIYDLGYRHYEGERRGRLYAMWSLYVESLRGVWGFGRPMTAKAVPLILAGFYALPALIQLAFSSAIASRIQSSGEQIELLSYDTYFASFFVLVLFFLVAQAPELVCRDQRYHVLPLYFTRSMGRMEYAFSKLGALVTALFILLIVPAIALFIGDVLMKPDAFKAIGDELPKFLPAIPANLLVAAGLAAICLAVSSFSPRRAYSAIGIVAFVLLSEAIPGVLYSVAQPGDWTEKLQALAPVTSLIGATDWFFGQRLGGDFVTSLGSDAFLWSSLITLVIFIAVLLFRYRRVPA